MEQADESSLALALSAASQAGVEAEDIEMGEAKLHDLRSLTTEQKKAKEAHSRNVKARDHAFILVKRNDALSLQQLLASLDAGTPWQKWRNQAGWTLQQCAHKFHAAEVQICLASFSAADSQALSTETSVLQSRPLHELTVDVKSTELRMPLQWQ